MYDSTIDHDYIPFAPPKLPRQSKIELDPIHGVLPFDGVRNPGSRSAVSQRVWLTYRTAANGWRPKVGICESWGEAGAALTLLLVPTLDDLRFQPLTVTFEDEDGKKRKHTHDLEATFQNGHRRLVYVRNAKSLDKPRTQRDINAIKAATPEGAANDMIIVEADSYTRQRRDNLVRMHMLVFADPDPEADEITLWVAQRKPFRLMKDLFPQTPLPQRRVFRAVYRLVARRQLHANLDHVLWEHSKIELPK